MGLDVDIGWTSVAGPRKDNEDFAAAAAPQGEATRGVIAALADGVSGGGRGREASRSTVLGLLRDYFGTPETWETSVALDRLVGAQNSWLVAGNRHRTGAAATQAVPGGGGSGGAMTTLTALVLRGHSYTLAHVGDSRAWLYRDGQCTQLTQDHVFDHPDQRSRLTRALGLDDAVRLDYEQGEVRRGDVFVLTSDGVHGSLNRVQIAAHAHAAREGSARAATDALVEAAVRAGSRDDASALIVHVRELAAAQLSDVQLRGRVLPPAPRLRPGDVLDGFRIDSLLADTGLHRLYRATELASGDAVALKALHESRASDPAEREMLAHEAWLGMRLAQQTGTAVPGGFVAVREPAGQSAFYVVFDWHAGSTLQEMLAARQPFTIAQVVQGALALARALGRLHRQGVVHRDIKPANLHLGQDNVWRILDLGVAISGRESAEQRELHAGTPSYMNPEQWEEREGEPAAMGPHSDLFALGVTLYQWLTGHLPYGEVEPYQLARFRRDPKAPSRLRPDVPIWLDHVVLKAVARDPRKRFETAEELVLALERGASRPLAGPGHTPLLTRDPTAMWKVGLGVSVLLNLLLVFWLLFLPR
jgi:serine/threonine protein phosphatase PrpC